MDLDLRLVRSFVVLTEERHFGRAAARLHLTSSALTKQIQRLESSVGARLLQRGPGGIQEPSEEGIRFSMTGAALLKHADEVCAEILVRPGPYTVRIGFPAGSLGALSARIPLHDIARDLHLAFPEASFVCCEIAFDDLNRCLPQERIDVLWTSAEVAHPLVESVPLQVTSGLVGLVADRHPFAAASCVDVTELADRPLLYNPAAPKEWMRPFWLADIRPRRDAQLIPTSGSSHAAATTAAAKEGVAMVTVTMDADIYKPPGTQIISLRHAQRMRMFAARRRTDRRSAVLALIDRFKLLPADTCP